MIPSFLIGQTLAESITAPLCCADSGEHVHRCLRPSGVLLFVAGGVGEGFTCYISSEIRSRSASMRFVKDSQSPVTALIKELTSLVLRQCVRIADEYRGVTGLTL
jgi:hypothetical protein